jgi:2-iminobutanoate/2-iminopropanoate deaminase
MKQIISSDKAPGRIVPAIGPYSPGVSTGELIFTAGQIGIDPATGNVVEGGIQAETRQVLINVRSILEAAGSSLDAVVKTTVFLRDMNDFAAMNAVYGEFFGTNPPARSTIAVAGLPRNVAVEIETIALAGKK